jgi:iron complex outermembrane recepter protein
MHEQAQGRCRTTHGWSRAGWLNLSWSCAALLPLVIHAQTMNAGNIDEVIVTAQKRSERLRDVPVPVTAVSADELSSTNQVRLQDYFTRVPGLSLTPVADADSPVVSIRGITTGGTTNPTVGIVVDDVPYGSSTRQGAGFTAPDIDPSDLARVEVLRGPQGTLYGASSLGGLIKFATIEPSTDAVQGLLQGGTTSVRNGDGLGYSVRGMVNMPLSDTTAIRASAFTRRLPGYIDDPVIGIDGVNRTDVDGGRLTALWRPSDTFSLKVGALLQESERQGTDEVHELPGLGEFEQSALRGTGLYKRQAQAYSAVADAKLGRVSLTSVTGYSVDELDSNLDVSPFYGAFVAQPLFGVSGASSRLHGETTRFSQELRLSMSLGDRVQWLIGAFYTDEDANQPDDFLAVDPVTGDPVGMFIANRVPSTYEEYALFTNFTFQLTDRFDVQIGGRQSHNENSFSTLWFGPVAPIFFGADPFFIPESRAEDEPFTYLVTPRFKITPDVMAYARLASGYRPGGPNGACTGTFACRYEADTTVNYEAGLKAELLGGALALDASVYYIDWQDIQLNSVDPNTGVGFIANGGEARSRGAELAMEAHPTDGLTIAGWVAWNDAELSEISPDVDVVAAPGDRLPYSSEFSGSVSIDQMFPIGTMTGLIGGSVNYVDDREGVFPSIFSGTTQRQVFPSYSQVDLRLGIRFDSWSVDAFVNNATDKRGVLTGGLDKIVYKYGFNYIQPRTIGLSLTKSF